MIVLRMLAVLVVVLVTALALMIQFDKIGRALDQFQQHVASDVTREANRVTHHA